MGGRVVAGWLGLVVLYTALTESERLSQSLGIGNSALAALSDPSRPLIRDRSQTAPPPTAPPTPITVPHSPQPNPPPALDPFPWQHPEPDPSPAFLQRH